MQAAAPDGLGGLSETILQFLPCTPDGTAPDSAPGSLARSSAGGFTAVRVPTLQLAQTPAPPFAIPAPQQRLNEAPWTQNTARALRRAQQEVAELCAAQGHQLPAERALLFDLTGMRAHGCKGNSKPITTSCSGGGSHSSNSSAGGARTSSTGGAAAAAAAGAGSSGAAGCARNRQASDAGVPGNPSGGAGCNSSSGCASPTTPVSPSVPAGAPAMFKRQYTPVDSILGEQGQEAAAQQQQQQQQQPKAQQRRRLQTQQEQCQQRPPGANRPVAATVRTCRARPSHLAAAALLAPSAQAMTRRREATSNPHLQVNSCSRMLQASTSHSTHQHGSAGGRSHSARPGSAAAARNASAQYYERVLPAGWWASADRALSDPLLLCMPVWLREALELELMP